MAPRRKARGNQADKSDAAPAAPVTPPPPSRMNMWDFLSHNLHDLKSMVTFIGAGGLALVIAGTPESRALFTAMFQNGGVRMRRWRNLTINTVREMTTSLQNGLFWMAGLSLGIEVLAALVYRIEIKWPAIMFVYVVNYALIWYHWAKFGVQVMTVGAIWKFFDTGGEKELAELFKQSPWALMANRSQPAIQGSINFLGDYANILGKIVFFHTVGTAILMLAPWADNPMMLWPSPIIIAILVHGNLHWRKPDRGVEWRVIVLFVLVLLGVMISGAIVPQWTEWLGMPIPQRDYNVPRRIAALIAVLIAYRWIQNTAVRQTHEYQDLYDADGKQVAKSSSSQSRRRDPRYDSNSRRNMVYAALTVVALLLLFTNIGATLYRMTDGGRVTRPHVYNAAVKAGLYGFKGSRQVGVDAIPEAVMPIRSELLSHQTTDAYEVFVYGVTVPATVGPLDSKVLLYPGDSVKVEVSTETYGSKGDGNAVWPVRLGGTIVNGRVQTPHSFPDMREYWKHYPNVALPDGGFLGRLMTAGESAQLKQSIWRSALQLVGVRGPKSDVWFIGNENNFRVEGGGMQRLYYLLNQPQTPGNKMMFTGEIETTVTVYRPIA